MTSIGRKLARFTADAETRAPGAPEVPERAPPTRETKAAQTLSDLRRQIAAILEQPHAEQPHAVSPPCSAPVGIEQLPFTLLEREEGRIWRRLSRIPPAYQVGVRACGSGALADLRLLALLALDPELSEYQSSDALFLDTETTGFGGAGTVAFLIGLAFVTDGELWLEQLFLEGPEHEAALLLHLRERMQGRRVLVSFNGKSFDWPLLVGRYVMNRLPPPSEFRHLDLLHVARRVHKQRLTRCSLQSVEAMVLGFERFDDVGGAEVAARYLHYCRTGDAAGLEGVLEHNYWDVLSMVALVGVYGEPAFDLPASDVTAAASTLVRAKALSQALTFAERAVDGGGGERALIVRAEIRKALGDKHGALADLELARSSPVARLQLAKLYEHFMKDAPRALGVVDLGTSEAPSAALKRRERLLRKSAADRFKC